MLRRTFLLYGITIPIAALGNTPLFAKTKSTDSAVVIPKRPLGQSFSYENFMAHIGDEFLVYGQEEGLHKVIPLRIAEVILRSRDEKSVQFSVRFSGPAEYPLQGGVYSFEGNSDEFRLLLNPAGEDEYRRHYFADFNLLRKSSKAKPR